MENRIQKIIDEKALSLNAFAQEIGVNRSTISHILTGRNKPSVEVLQKILKRFSKISPNWLLLGNGGMHVQTVSEQAPTDTLASEEVLEKEVEKVVVFYTDHTFQEYKPS